MPRTQWKSAAIILILFSGACLLLERLDNPPDINVVLIVIDTLRADHLPFYGYEKNTAPFLNELSARSVVFDRAYSASSWTSPATASIHTSLYPFQHGVVTGLSATKRLQENVDKTIVVNRIPDDVVTVAEMLKDAGYQTYAVAANHNIIADEGFAQGFDWFSNLYVWRKDYPPAELLNERVGEWSDVISSGGKYFLYVHYNDPHQPYHEREPWFAENAGGDADDIVTAYDSEIWYADQHIRQLFEMFGWQKNTLIIITADHGEEFVEHEGRGHGNSLYDEVIHVPLLVYFPGWRGGGVRIPEPVHTIDILPTIREYLGLEASLHAEGESLLPLLEKEGGGDRFLYSHLVRKRGEYGQDLVKEAAINGRWKFIVTKPDTYELYDLESDPGETHNVFNESDRIAALLEEKLGEFERTSIKLMQEEARINLTYEALERLRNIGYVT